MLTFQDQYAKLQKITGDYSAEGLETFKEDLNEGATIFLNRLGRKFNRKYKTTNLVAGKQYYQFSADILRISTIRCLNGDSYYTPRLVADEDYWNSMNTVANTGSYPSHFFIRGFNEVGLYPTPSTAVAAGIEVSYEPQHVQLTKADFTTGTVTVENGSVAVTHSAAGFTSDMVGRWLQVTDGTDGRWYRIASYVSSSQLNLENYYEGITAAGRSFRIGEVMAAIPQGYQMAPVFYALQMFYLEDGDEKAADRYELRFDRKIKSAKGTYGKSTSQMGVKMPRGSRRRPSWIDLTPPVQYP
jgi:hypothetical protein